jgi:hypothetical protein
MIHYHIYFSLRDPEVEQEAVSIIRQFLAGLREAGAIAGFRLLRNGGGPPKSALLPLEALVEFRDPNQFSSAFATQAAQGIHTGLHGRVMELVSKFQVEVFHEIPSTILSASAPPPGEFACEV